MENVQDNARDGKESETKEARAPMRRPLTARQEMAVRALGKGQGVLAAAKVVGVSRQTMYRWMAEPAFIAAMNRWNVAVLAVARGQILAGLGDAADTVVKAAREGNVKAAMMLLKNAGVFEGGVSDSMDAEVIGREQDLRQRSDRSALDRAEVNLRDADQVTDMLKREDAPGSPPIKIPDPWEGWPEPETGSMAHLCKLFGLPPDNLDKDLWKTWKWEAEKSKTPTASASRPAASAAAPAPPAGPESSDTPATEPAAPTKSAGGEKLPDSKRPPNRPHAYSPGQPEPIDWLEDQFIDIAREDWK